MHKHLCPRWVQVNHQNGNGLDNTGFAEKLVLVRPLAPFGPKGL